MLAGFPLLEISCSNTRITLNEGRELLNTYLFYSLNEVRIMCQQWRLDYNKERPHKSLGYLSPLLYASKWQKDQQLYSQTANGNHAKIEESRLVDKAVDNNQPNKTLPAN